MPPTTIHSAPSVNSYTSLAEHQSQTPKTFFDEKPVLHFHGANSRALTSRDQILRLPIFAQDAPAEGEVRDVVVETIDTFVGSDQLTLYNNTTSVGLSIPYPSISLHAIQRIPDPTDASKEVHGLYMQLELSDPASVSEEDELDGVELTLIPTGADVKALFDAVSNCSNLHPDPMQEDDEMEDADGGDRRIMFEGNVGYEGISGLPGVQMGSDNGGLPPPFPGSGGWITAENVGDFFDADGNFIGGSGEVLGEGAGRVRGRDETDENESNANGNGNGAADDNKRSRTE
ncbi:hypothetical protein PVAG01_04649 [Phlyctema vagabunda]|uniref:Uncharacterized protein n=1 Tax=Phlyctema vagabunda TaxID=108571 RepID=A0ABR4PII0_9HELO